MRFNERQPKADLFYVFVHVPKKETPRVFIMDSKTTMKLWRPSAATPLPLLPGGKLFYQRHATTKIGLWLQKNNRPD